MAPGLPLTQWRLDFIIVTWKSAKSFPVVAFLSLRPKQSWRDVVMRQSFVGSGIVLYLLFVVSDKLQGLSLTSTAYLTVTGQTGSDLAVTVVIN
jgi:hypothetical protein